MFQCGNGLIWKFENGLEFKGIRHCEATRQSLQGNKQIAALRPPGGGLARNDDKKAPSLGLY